MPLFTAATLAQKSVAVGIEGRQVDGNDVVAVYDIVRQAIEKARAGVYPVNIAADVSPERLARFFTQEDGAVYGINKSVRDRLVFAEQDVIKDPPFSKIDLISCCNLLIYLGPLLQKRAISLFHYALKPGGYLFTGEGEVLHLYAHSFEVQEREECVFYRKREDT